MFFLSRPITSLEPQSLIPMMSRSLLAKLAVSFSVVALIALAGCGDDGLGKRYPVSGKVTYKGKPVAKGSISFIAVAPDGRGAAGEITDGQYSMTTQSPGDGAFPGSYTVTITALDVDMAAADAATKKMADKNKMAMPGMPDQAAVAKATRTAKNDVPQKYSTAGTSGLKAEVKEQPTVLDFPLED